MTQTEHSASFRAVSSGETAPATPETPATPSGLEPGSVSHSAPVATPPVAKPRRRLPARLFGWFWLGSAIKSARQSVKAQRASKFNQRARAAAELARRALEPVEPFRSKGLEAFACDLYAQSVYWALKSLAAAPFANPDAAQAAAAERADHEPTEELWPKVDQALLPRAAGGSDELARLQIAVNQSSFVKLAELPHDEQARLASSLRKFAEALIAEIELPERTLDVLLLRRLWRIGLILAMIAAIAAAAFGVNEYVERSNDLARGKPWRQSSMLVSGCPSPKQSCPESRDFFMHTRDEENPWLEIDLGQPQKFSAVRIENRKDYGLDRAVPLVVEVSTDQQNWRQIARRETVFNSWRANFAPVQARWVRIRVARRSLLHLSRVRILP